MKASKKQSKPQASGRSLHPVIQIPNLENYVPGHGCQCEAWNESECGCRGVDWTPREVYELRAKLQAAMFALIRLRDCEYAYAVAVANEALERIYHLNPTGQTRRDD